MAHAFWKERELASAYWAVDEALVVGLLVPPLSGCSQFWVRKRSCHPDRTQSLSLLYSHSCRLATPTPAAPQLGCFRWGSTVREEWERGIGVGGGGMDTPREPYRTRTVRRKNTKPASIVSANAHHAITSQRGGCSSSGSRRIRAPVGRHGSN